jgi:hypothetical protein
MLDGEILPTADAPQTRDVDLSGVLGRRRCEIPHLLREMVEHSVPLTLDMSESATLARGPLMYIDEGNNMLLVECPAEAARGLPRRRLAPHCG